MGRVALYLSGCGSLDGSDPMTTIMAMEVLEQHGYDVQPVGRDVEQGQVLNHLNAQPEAGDRNSLEEAARLVRGDIKDMRQIEPDVYDAACLVGGGGTLSTWTDYHERSENCRITERLKYQLLDFFGSEAPVLCLDNAAFVVCLTLKERNQNPVVNLGSNDRLNRLVSEWGADVTDESPSWDPVLGIGSVPDLTKRQTLSSLREAIEGLLDRSGLVSDANLDSRLT